METEYLRNKIDNDTESTTIQSDSNVIFTNITKPPMPDSSPLDEFPDDFFTGISSANDYTWNVHSRNT